MYFAILGAYVVLCLIVLFLWTRFNNTVSILAELQKAEREIDHDVFKRMSHKNNRRSIRQSMRKWIRKNAKISWRRSLPPLVYTGLASAFLYVAGVALLARFGTTELIGANVWHDTSQSLLNNLTFGVFELLSASAEHDNLSLFERGIHFAMASSVGLLIARLINYFFDYVWNHTYILLFPHSTIRAMKHTRRAHSMDSPKRGLWTKLTAHIFDLNENVWGIGIEDGEKKIDITATTSI